MKLLRSPAVLLVAITLVGTILRYSFASPFNFVIDSDEAIVGLMAKHILEGKGIPVFYYGQHYMGSLEPVLVALSFRLFGISNEAMKLVPFLFSIALIPIMYLLAKRCAGTTTALITALLVAVPPTPLVVWSSKARGGFIEVIVLGALAFLYTCVWLQKKRPELKLTALIGFILGVGWWVNNQIIYFILPIGLVFLEALLYQPAGRRIKDLFAHGSVGLVTFILGGLPFWIYNLTHDFATFGMFGGAESKDIGEHITGLFSTALPIILGGMRFWQENEYFPGGSEIALLSYGTLFFIAVALHFRALTRFVTLRGVSNERPFEMLIVFVLSTMAIFALSSFGYLVQAPRYLLPMYVGLMPLCGYAISRMGQFVGTFVTIIILAINLGSSFWGEKAVPGEPYVYNGERAAQDHTELIQWLTEHNHHFVRTNYWIGYRLAFETKEQVKFLMFQDPFQVRIPEYEEAGHHETLTSVPLVLVFSQAKIVRNALRALGIKYKEIVLSGYSVIYDQEPLAHPDHLVAVPASNVVAHASPHDDRALLALDDSVKTRWASGEHQHPGMFFAIKFREPISFRALRMEMGEWPHDYPRELQILIHRVDGGVHELIDRQEYQAIRYLAYNEALELYSEPELIESIEFKQNGSHAIFDWSIAEIHLFE